MSPAQSQGSEGAPEWAKRAAHEISDWYCLRDDTRTSHDEPRVAEIILRHARKNESDKCLELSRTREDINGILEECAKHITLSNDLPWSEEVHCAFRHLSQAGCPECFGGVVPVFNGDNTTEKPCPSCAAKSPTDEDMLDWLEKWGFLLNDGGDEIRLESVKDGKFYTGETLRDAICAAMSSRPSQGKQGDSKP